MKKSCLLLFVLLTAIESHAAIITYQFTGAVTDVAPSLGNGFAVGDTVVGSFSASTIDGQSAPSLGSYDAANLQVTVGGHYTVTAASGNATVFFNNLSDSFNPNFTSNLTGAPINGLLPTYFDVQLDFLPGTFSSDALPLTLPLSSLWPLGGDRSNFLFGALGSNRLSYRIQSIQAVPLPAAALLFVSGLATLWAKARQFN